MHRPKASLVLDDAPTTSYTHEEACGGIFGGGEEKTLTVRARHGFKVRYIELDECEPKSFVMKSFAINFEEQCIMPGPISLDVFRNQAPIMVPVSQADITLDVKNVTRKTLRLRMRLVGEVG